MKQIYTEGNARKGKEINFQWFLDKLFVHWKLFILCICLGLGIGYVYLRYSTQVYNIGATIVLKDNKRGGMGNSELSVFESMGLINSNNNVDNEVEMLVSRNLIEGVVRELNLYTYYIVKGRFKDTELYSSGNYKYYNTIPVSVYLDQSSVDKLVAVLSLNLENVSGKTRVWGTYGTIGFDKEFSSLPAILETAAGNVLLQPSGVTDLLEEYPLQVSIYPPVYIAKHFLSRLNAESTSKTTSVVRLSLKETHCKRGEAFLSKLVEMYNRDAMEDKNKAASNAAHFINDRLVYINEDLNNVEMDIEAYKRENRLTDIGLESQLILGEDNEYEKQLVRIGTQMELLNLLRDEVKRAEMTENLLPANVGLSDPGLAEAIQKYNSALMERERISAYTSQESPIIIRLDERVSSILKDINVQIAGAQQALNTQKKDLKSQSNNYDSYLGDIPRREREFVEKTRQQQIKSNLYVTLLEKKEEAELSLAVTAPSAKVIESPLAGGNPISPNRMMTYAICLFLSILFPFVGLGIREILNYKIENEQEVRKYSHVPVVVTLPNDKSKNPVVVSAHATTPIVERFRLLRTNLQFTLENQGSQVILVTSSISGEGKTFVSINLAMTYALKYKTLLVGLDIRRPKLDAYMELPKKAGIVSYLSGYTRDIHSLIHRNVNGSSLDVMLAGNIPPNPNELLMEKNLDDLFQELRKRYDYVIVDTSPVGSVSDTFLLDRIADASLFVVRQGYTPKAILSLAESIFTEKRLKNLNLVLNGFSEENSGRYGYGYGYGYGYSSQET